MVQATPLNLLVKSHLALLLCNIIWACDYPFYNLVLSKYVAPIALVTASLCAAALFSLVPLLWSKARPIARKDIKTMIGAALLIGVIRKVLLMYGLSRTSPIDGSIIDTITPLLVLLISVVLGIDNSRASRSPVWCWAWQVRWVSSCWEPAADIRTPD